MGDTVFTKEIKKINKDCEEFKLKMYAYGNMVEKNNKAIELIDDLMDLINKMHHAYKGATEPYPKSLDSFESHYRID
ncbi:MAG: hypothetical protein ABIJ17_02420 [Patescibacteria group bacterium]